MPAPTVGTPTLNTIVSGSTTLSVAAPTMSDGDLLVAFGFSGDTVGRTTSPPSGWTQIYYSGSVTLSPSGAKHIYVWYKQIATAAGEPANYDFTLGDAFANAKISIVAVTGAEDPATTAIVVATGHDTASGSTTDSPGITPTVDDSLILRIIANGRNSASYTYPASTEILDDGTSYSLSAAKTTGGTSGVASESVTNSPTWHTEYRHVVLAIAPPSGGGNPWYYYQQAG